MKVVLVLLFFFCTVGCLTASDNASGVFVPSDEFVDQSLLGETFGFENNSLSNLNERSPLNVILGRVDRSMNTDAVPVATLLRSDESWMSDPDTVRCWKRGAACSTIAVIMLLIGGIASLANYIGHHT